MYTLIWYSNVANSYWFFTFFHRKLETGSFQFAVYTFAKWNEASSLAYNPLPNLWCFTLMFWLSVSYKNASFQNIFLENMNLNFNQTVNIDCHYTVVNFIQFSCYHTHYRPQNIDKSIDKCTKMMCRKLKVISSFPRKDTFCGVFAISCDR